MQSIRRPEEWKARPAKLRQKDRDARLTWFASKPLPAKGWTVKFSQAKEWPDGTKPPVDIAIPPANEEHSSGASGCKNHIPTDRRSGLIRTYLDSNATAHDGARLREGLLDRANTAGTVFADTAYTSGHNVCPMAERYDRCKRDCAPGTLRGTFRFDIGQTKGPLVLSFSGK